MISPVSIITAMGRRNMSCHACCDNACCVCRPAGAELLHSPQRGLPHPGLPEPQRPARLLPQRRQQQWRCRCARHATPTLHSLHRLLTSPHAAEVMRQYKCLSILHHKHSSYSIRHAKVENLLIAPESSLQQRVICSEQHGACAVAEYSCAHQHRCFSFRCPEPDNLLGAVRRQVVLLHLRPSATGRSVTPPLLAYP